MAELMDSLAKSIARIEEYTRQPDFEHVLLEQVLIRAEKLDKYYERFVKAHEKQMERVPKQAKRFDQMAAEVERYYFAAHSLLAAKRKVLTPSQPPIAEAPQPLAVQVHWPYQQHDLKILGGFRWNNHKVAWFS